MNNKAHSNTGRNKDPRANRRFLRKLWPDSLFGQLFLIFTLGFMALMLIGIYHGLRTRQYFSIRSVMWDRATRMAHMALVLDTAHPESRTYLLERLSNRGFTLEIEKAEPNLAEHTPDNLQDSAAALERIFNLALESLWEADLYAEGSSGESPTPNPPQITGTPGATDISTIFRQRPEPTIQMASVAITEQNIPGFTGDLIEILRRTFHAYPSENTAPLYVSRAAIPLRNGDWLVISDKPRPFTGFMGLPLKEILAVEAFFLIISLLAFYFIVKPLRRMTQAADSFDLDQPNTPPLPETGPREVREGAQAFNRMQNRIRNFVNERSDLLAALSHDLRTPLTRMRLRVEQLDDKTRLAMQKDMDELQQLMDSSIDLARNSSEEVALLDVGALLESLVEDYRDQGKDVTLQDADKIMAVAPLAARPIGVKRCLGNLLENAVCYGNGKVTVGIKDGKHELAIIICDNGPGILPDSLERVFEPFYRLERSRNRSTGGSGLGLPIARSMARAHGGGITLVNRSEGGLCATATFKRI